jgi:hypothetical protein
MIGSATVPVYNQHSIPSFAPLSSMYIVKIASACAGGFYLTGTAGIQRPHVEDINPLHLPQNLNTLETSRLLEIGGDGAGLGTLGEEIILALDLCIDN